MGLPDDWPRISRWTDTRRVPYCPAQRPSIPIQKKCPDIPTLPSYKTTPHSSFWAVFPSRPLPKEPQTPVDISSLRDLLEICSPNFTASEKIRASTLLEELSHGVDAHQLHPLPAATIPNSGSVLAHGEIFTDNLANWIRKGFVAGPFHIPPCKDFRSNSMLAVTQKDKVRVIMDLSNPEGECFNDNVDKNSVEKVHMATAKEFGYAVVECGHGACGSLICAMLTKIYQLNSLTFVYKDLNGYIYILLRRSNRLAQAQL